MRGLQARKEGNWRAMRRRRYQYNAKKPVIRGQVCSGMSQNWVKSELKSLTPPANGTKVHLKVFDRFLRILRAFYKYLH